MMLGSRSKRTFAFVFVTLFIDLLAFTLILPLLPKILDYYETNDKSSVYKLFDEKARILQEFLKISESNNQVLLAGVLGSWFSLLQFISSPLLGALSDKFGRKTILLMAMSGSLLSYATWFLASDNFGLFVISRTIGGLSKANVGISLAIISDVTNESSRGAGMAMVGSSFSLAFICGPLLGAYLSTLARGGHLQSQLITNPSLIALLLSTINIAIVILFLDETNTLRKERKKVSYIYIDKKNLASNLESKHRATRSRNKALHYVNPRSLFKFELVENMSMIEAKILKKTGLVYFYYLLFYSGLEFTLSFLTHSKFGFSSMDQGKLYLYSGLLMASIQGSCMRFMKGGRERKMAIFGLATIIPSFILMGLSNTINQIYLSLTMYAIASAIVVPCLTTIVSNNSPIESRGVVMGTFRSIGALARAIGPCFASALFWIFGSTFCYIVGALALILPLYIMSNLQQNSRGTKQSHNNTLNKKLVDKIPLAKAN